jgi:predicted nucleic acid-binding protein
MGILKMLERLLDSVILIDHFNNIPRATKFIFELDPAATAISVISLAEILVGFDKEGTQKAKILLDQFRLLPIDGPVAEKAAELRRGFGWKLPDALQAALAILHNIFLTTRNIRDFDPKKHSFVEIPYKI